jgi:hypothetical protein
MDEHAKQLRRFLLETNLERGGNIVHPRQRQLVRHRAMARHIQPVAHPPDLHIMEVEHLGKFVDHSLQPLFDATVAHDLVSSLDRGRLALNVRQDG